MKLQRYDPPRSFPTKPLPWRQSDDGDWCNAEDVAELEAKCAELEAKFDELEVKYEQLRAASFQLVFVVGLTPFRNGWPGNELTRTCNEVLALVDPLKKQVKGNIHATT